MRRYWLYFISMAILFSPIVNTQERVLVFAASSMASALSQIAQKYQQETGAEVTLSFGSSSALARQLVYGAPADIFISANQKWMDYAVKENSIDEKSLSPWLKNTLVVVSSQPQLKPINLNAQEILEVVGETRLAIANPQYVPAGIYAKEALETKGIWQALQGKMAFSNSVRATLALVEREEAQLGIVYFTDAKASSKVSIVAIISPQTHGNIVFPKAMTKVAKKGTERFFAYLDSSSAKHILTTNGFVLFTSTTE